MVPEITRFLSGGHDEVKKELQRKMEAAAEELEFERAKEFRDQIIAIDAVMEKQKITMADAMDRDVFGYRGGQRLDVRADHVHAAGQNDRAARVDVSLITAMRTMIS